MNESRSPSVSTEDARRLRQVATLAASGAVAVPALIEALREPSWAVRRSAVAALAQLGEPAVAPLVSVLTGARTHEALIAAAIDALVLSVGDVEAAIFALEGSPAPVVYDVALILGRRRSGPGVPLLTRLVRHPDENVAVAAIEALGQLGGDSGLAALVEAAQSGSFFRTFPAMDVLSRTGHPDAVPPLLALLRQPHFALEAIRALGQTADSRAVRPLIGQLVAGDPDTVMASARSLVAIHDAQVRREGRSTVGDALHSEALPRSLSGRLAERMAGADAADRRALCLVLGWVGGEEAITALLLLLHDAPESAALLGQALNQLGKSGEAHVLAAVRKGDSVRRLALLPLLRHHHSAVPEIMLCLSDPEPAVSAAACEALGSIGDASVVAQLLPCLGSTNPRVSQAALGAIQALGSPQTEELVLEAARAGSAQLRRNALRIIGYFGYPSGLGALLAAMSDPDEKLRDVALYGLPFLEDPRALEALLGAAQHEAPRTRAAAMRALGQTQQGQRVVDRLCEGLHDPDPWVRYYAVQSLGKLRVDSVAAELIKLLDDPAGQVRVAVVDALAYLETPVALAVLHRTSGSADPDVQRAALLGLGVTRKKESLPVVLTGMRSADPSTRLVALSALAGFSGPEILPALLEAAHDAADSVRVAAIGFLAARAEATRELVSLLSDLPVRAAVLEALATPAVGRVAGLQEVLVHADEQLAPLVVGALRRLDSPESTAALLQALRASSPAGRKAAARVISGWKSISATAALERAAREDADPDVRRIATLALVP